METLTTSAGSGETVDFTLDLEKICVADETRCVAGGDEAIETCGQRGNIWTSQPCPTGRICDPETVSCIQAFDLDIARFHDLNRQLFESRIDTVKRGALVAS